MKEIFRATVVRDLSKPLEGCGPIQAWGVGIDDTVCAVAPRSSATIRVLRGDASFEFRPAKGAIYSLVQPFGADACLLVDARTRGEPNAIVINDRGDIVRRFLLGDGIEDVRVDADRNVWVSYFDEGVFSNDPLSSAGLRMFDENGASRWAMDPSTDAIDDAYAINLEPDGTLWTYYYSSFPVVRVRNGEKTKWNYGEAGGRALAIGQRGVFLLTKSGVRRLEFRGDSLRRVEIHAIVDENGAPLSGPAYGRGSAFWFLSGSKILRANV